MKAIFVSGDDYAALTFEEKYSGHTVRSIIDSGITEIEGEEGYTEITVVEVGDVSEEFLSFVRNRILDYDQSKHENFWLEDELIDA